MKYITLLCDGMADFPVEVLGNKTPMEVSNTPVMDMLSKTSEIGMVKTVPDGLKPGSDVANLSVMGYDPTVYYTGRSPLEAINIGVDMTESDVAMRCNLVTLSDETDFYNKRMVDYCAGDISSEEASEIVKSLQDAFGNDYFEFYNGVSYRHCLLWKNGNVDCGYFTPPHDISGKVIGSFINDDPAAKDLIDMMIKSGEILKNHPVNLERIKKGLNPATNIWLWGQGKKPTLPDFKKKNGLNGSVISAVDLIKGIGKCANMRVPHIDGATGYINTNFEGKAKAAINEIDKGAEFVYIHVEAPDECGHRGEIENKVKSLELIDELILRYLVDELEKRGDFSIMILPDHPTPLSTMTHCSDPVPYMIYRSNQSTRNTLKYNEKDAAKSDVFIEDGYKLLDRFINRRV